MVAFHQYDFHRLGPKISQLPFGLHSIPLPKLDDLVCPKCNRTMRLVWVSSDRKTLAYRCLYNHRPHNPTYLVKED